MAIPPFAKTAQDSGGQWDEVMPIHVLSMAGNEGSGGGTYDSTAQDSGGNWDAVVPVHIVSSDVDFGSGGGGTPATVPSFSAFLTGAPVALAKGAFTKIPFQSVDWDITLDYDAVTNFRFTPSEAGRYNLNVAADIAVSTDLAPVIIISIFKNGVEHKRGSRIQTPLAEAEGGDVGLSFSAMVEANGTTDYFEAFIFVNAPDPTIFTIATGETLTWFQGEFLRAPEVFVPADWSAFTMTAGDLGSPYAGWLSKLQSEAPDDFGSISNEPSPDASLYVMYYTGTQIEVTFQGDVVNELNHRRLMINGVEAARIGSAALDGSGFKTMASYNTQFTGGFSANGVYPIEFVPE